MANTLTYLESLMKETQKSEDEIMALAFQTGIRQLWRERVLSQLLRDKISRDEAIKAVGIDWVDLAERQHQAMKEDLAWATNV